MPPPEVVGSGKFGTPCERMHEANLMPCAVRFEALFLGGLEEPQPATAAMQQTTATTIGSGRR
jgi:hypothetical protein